MKKQFQPHHDLTDGHRLNPQIAHLLTQSTAQLDSDIVSSLARARVSALEKQRVHESALSLSAIGHRVHDLIPQASHQWLAAIILLATLVFGLSGYWQGMQEKQDLDLKILTSDLPMSVFVDK
ncbi:MAG: DUF3619 family protein [Gallionella sp.]